MSSKPKAKKVIVKKKATKSATPKAKAPKPKVAKPKAEKTTEVGGKLGTILKMIQRPSGATLEDMMAATEWKSHSVRAAVTDALRKKRGYQIVSERIKGEATVYKIADSQQ